MKQYLKFLFYLHFGFCCFCLVHTCFPIIDEGLAKFFIASLSNAPLYRTSLLGAIFLF